MLESGENHILDLGSGLAKQQAKKGGHPVDWVSYPIGQKKSPLRKGEKEI